MDTKEIKSLLDELNSPDWWVRSTAIKELLTQSEDTFIQYIEDAIGNHENATLRNAAMEFYRALGARGMFSLVKLLKNEDEEVRLFAANILGDIKERRAVPALMSALKDPNVNVRIASAEALGHTGAPEAVPALCEVLTDESWVVMAAIKAFGDIGGAQALDALYKCLEMSEYKAMVFEAIEKSGNFNSIRILSSYLEKDELKDLAMKAIISISEREGVRPMPTFFMGIVPYLIDLQKSQRSDVRKSAFVALSWSEDPRGLSTLIDAVNNEELQEYALSGIISIGKKAVPSIVDALKDYHRTQRYVLAKVLTMLGEHTALIQFAKDPDPEVRVEVAFALGHIYSPKSAEVLQMLTSDTEEEVSSAAKVALKNLGKF